MKEAQASINATVAQILGEGVGRDPQFDAIKNAQAQLAQQDERFFDLASDDARRESQELDAASDSQQAPILLRRSEHRSGHARSSRSTTWRGSRPATARLETMRAGRGLHHQPESNDEATRIEDEATAAARNFLFAASGVVLLSLLLASIVARSIARPLSRLTQGAYRLSEEGLPALVEQLRHPEAEINGEEMAPIDIDSRDEIGQLASAFNAIQDVTKSVATRAGRAAAQGHRRHLRQPRSTQPDAARPPDRVHRSARVP